MAKQGLIDSVNEVRNMSSNLYQNSVPEVNIDSNIELISAPLLKTPSLMNEFINVLVQRIVYTQFETKVFRNPLKFLEGDNIPLGYLGQEIFINPAQGRDYDINDFAGLLEKYDSDVKVQYPQINFDKQYPVTVIRQKLKQAFTTWDNLETFIGAITNSLYNGAYIDEYKATKLLVTNAYRTNSVQVKTLQAPTTQELAKEFVKKARTMFLNFQAPSTNFNAWRKVGGYGRDIVTWAEKDDIVFLIRNDIQAELDVDVLASAFNIDKTSLLGRIVTVDNFNDYDKNGKLIYDGSNILGIMCDKSWFRIKTQDMYMEDFRNGNNRSMQYYLNLIKMYQYSFFANAVVFATKEPEIPITGLDFKAPEGITMLEGDKEGLDITVTPITGNSPSIEYTSSDDNVFIVDVDPTDNRHCILQAIGAGTATLTAKAGNVQATVNVTVSANA